MLLQPLLETLDELRMAKESAHPQVDPWVGPWVEPQVPAIRCNRLQEEQSRAHATGPNPLAFLHNHFSGHVRGANLILLCAVQDVGHNNRRIVIPGMGFVFLHRTARPGRSLARPENRLILSVKAH